MWQEKSNKHSFFLVWVSCSGLTAESLAGQTFTIRSVSTQTSVEYEYTLTVGPGGTLNQREVSGDRTLFSLGTHSGYDGLSETFSNGDSCGAYPSRRATVSYSFGTSTRILSATEPSVCRYEFEVQIDQSICAQISSTTGNCRLQERRWSLS